MSRLMFEVLKWSLHNSTLYYHLAPHFYATFCVNGKAIWCSGIILTGYALASPCPVCAGECGAVWHRNVAL